MIITSSMLYVELKEALNLPDHCYEINIRLAVDQAVTLEAKCFVDKDKIGPDSVLVKELKRYRLVEVEEPQGKNEELISWKEFVETVAPCVEPDMHIARLEPDDLAALTYRLPKEHYVRKIYDEGVEIPLRFYCDSQEDLLRIDIPNGMHSRSPSHIRPGSVPTGRITAEFVKI